MYVLKRRRRKLNARIVALQQNCPQSPHLSKLKNEVGLATIDIKNLINKRLDDREARAIDNINDNPKYFFSFAKRFSKTSSTVGPLRNSDGKLVSDPQDKAEALQNQYTTVFSKPEDVDIEASLLSVEISHTELLNDIILAKKTLSQLLRSLIHIRLHRMEIFLPKSYAAVRGR